MGTGARDSAGSIDGHIAGQGMADASERGDTEPHVSWWNRWGIDDEGMSTAEYAIGTIAAAAFGAILYTVVTGDGIVGALTDIIDRALRTSV